MKTFVTSDNGATYTVKEADSILTTVLNGLKNPFTGAPSSQSEQWFTIGYTAVLSVALSAIFFNRQKWFQKISKKYEDGQAKRYASYSSVNNA